jgi:hypothetical protein
MTRSEILKSTIAIKNGKIILGKSDESASVDEKNRLAYRMTELGVPRYAADNAIKSLSGYEVKKALSVSNLPDFLVKKGVIDGVLSVGSNQESYRVKGSESFGKPVFITKEAKR